MALYDHRVFKADGDWYVAQVHMGSGAGWGDATPRIQTETVTFTNLSRRDANSSHARIPAGVLNEISHESLLRVLRSAEASSSRFDMSPFNSPSDQDANDRIVVDEQGLSWKWREVSSVVLTNGRPTSNNALEFICLDDSALSRRVPVADDTTVGDFVAANGKAGLVSLIDAIKTTFRDLRPDTYR